MLGSRYGCRRDHVNEAVRVLVYQPDTFFTGFRSDQHDDLEAILLGNGTEFCLVILEGKVWNDHSVNAAFPAAPAEVLETVLHDGVQISHQYRRDSDLAADIGQLAEEFFQGHSVVKGLGCGLLDNRTVGHRVTERDSYFYHLAPFLIQSTDDFGCTFQRGTAGTEVNRQEIAGIVAE